jgi:hypothetical protein
MIKKKFSPKRLHDVGLGVTTYSYLAVQENVFSSSKNCFPPALPIGEKIANKIQKIFELHLRYLNFLKVPIFFILVQN